MYVCMYISLTIVLAIYANFNWPPESKIERSNTKLFITQG
jgi:hypothetical protein